MPHGQQAVCREDHVTPESRQRVGAHTPDQGHPKPHDRNLHEGERARPALEAARVNAIRGSDATSAIDTCLRVMDAPQVEAALPSVVNLLSRGVGLPTPAESDGLLATKLKYLLDKGMNVILAIGEPLPIREKGIDAVMQCLIPQLAEVKDLLDPARVVIAYAPVWSIGTGVTASPEQAQ